MCLVGIGALVLHDVLRPATTSRSLVALCATRGEAAFVKGLALLGGGGCSNVMQAHRRQELADGLDRAELGATGAALTVVQAAVLERANLAGVGGLDGPRLAARGAADVQVEVVAENATASNA